MTTPWIATPGGDVVFMQQPRAFQWLLGVTFPAAADPTSQGSIRRLWDRRLWDLRYRPSGKELPPQEIKLPPTFQTIMGPSAAVELGFQMWCPGPSFWIVGGRLTG